MDMLGYSFGRNRIAFQIPAFRSNPDVLHHALVFVVENVTMQNEISDIALITGSRLNRVAFRESGRIEGRIFDKQSVAPDADLVAVLRVGAVGAFAVGVNDRRAVRF